MLPKFLTVVQHNWGIVVYFHVKNVLYTRRRLMNMEIYGRKSVYNIQTSNNLCKVEEKHCSILFECQYAMPAKDNTVFVI